MTRTMIPATDPPAADTERAPPDVPAPSSRAPRSELHIKIHYIPEWSEIARLREHVALALADVEPSARNAAVMVASELAENAIKYGHSMPEVPGIEVSLVRAGPQLRISVVSGTRDIEAVARLQRCTEALAASEDKFDLYFERVKALSDAPEPKSQLGLYRISLEGGFELQCDYDDGVLRMTATRTLQ